MTESAEVKQEEPSEQINGLKRDHESATLNDGTGNQASVAKRPTIVPACRPKLHYTPLKTGLCYDVRMRYHAKIFTSYFEYIDPHPEDPRRIYRIYKILAENGLIDDPTLSGVDSIGDLMLKIPVREATDEEILQVHTKEHLEFISKTTSMTRDQLLKETEKGDSVYFNNDSYLSAKLSCGGAIEACKAVVEGRVKNALAVVRPPGHHAEPEVAGGFCLFSNVAVAAQNILKNYPESVRKIMVLDWDVHHGNGTQKAFYDDDRVLYISLHRHELGKYYPGTIHGNSDRVGEGKGEGFNCNIPWPWKGVGDSEYLWAFEQVIMPMGREFRPDLVIISSGFDAADGDTVGQCHVTPSCYGHMTHMLKSLARGNLCAVLEGGYSLDSIAKSALAVAKVLIGEPPDELPVVKQPKLEAVEVIDSVIKTQSKYWKCFKSTHGNDGCSFKEQATDTAINKNFPLQNAIRQQQMRLLANEFRFVTLPLFKKELPDDTAICSPNIYDASAIIVCVHDTPSIWAQRSRATGTIDPSTSIIVDTTLDVIKWASSRNYGVIDINIPQSLHEQDNYSAVITAQEVLVHIWDNYLKYFPSLNRVAFVAIGDAHSGVVHLLGHRDTRSVVKSAVSFVDQRPLRPLIPLVDETLADWYFKNSLVFASAEHTCWGNDGNENKKPRKKFGRVLKCDSDGINNILEERFEEATDFILDTFEEWSDSE
ncbi:histone deacetylase HDA1 [Lachancea thermotolerans CBS 6340]|uniref:Histone deacetylase n=1 Tax=Lachancea thermotolerans (strain ATCC 56472 / CBS 6340 / NRRL Y-8284) TaxID=559295 RepID=C5DMN5_LACTC|nr:KLTH0G10340p [Lachancea thermotolerans CBS 6340]CAR25046.1 KLTH0G10340p [Lachancea thermotolerans CBS 6340]